ncbi:outer membrane beta-barrel family protein [Pedobacter flavus]|uniref:Outer membrane beta-barrel family protein n=1 Tax=Pedobacter flavus TaxID=3113906 RepID=A0ABU7GYY6_9SPHI|nr:outer membrane beta-barrel family protein [Pedobacter sp. VNH31]MEE1884234.1 outer membrane beta-barrel family protein [Pedobacter sp. VNH31]
MRNKVLKYVLVFSLVNLITLPLFAQSNNTGVVSGKLIDAKTNESVPYGAAVLFDKKTMARVSAVQTDLDGNFVLPNIPFGVYTFKASYIGYQTMVRDSININASNRTISFGTIKMKESMGNEISEVSVTATRPTMQLGIDKKVFTVDQSLVSEGGSAADLLQNVPSVQTDIDGNVSLRGSNGVKVLIDGKPSLIAGGNIAQILQSIPSSSIESVELITNPSAKYDAEGQSGIINIVLKRNKKLGFNGSVALTGGIKNNYNGNTNLSFQNSKINLFGNYSYRDGNREGGGFNNINYLNNINPTSYANQNTDSKSKDQSHNLKAGIDVYLSDKDVLSFSGGFNVRDNNRNEMLRIEQLGQAFNPLQLSNRSNVNKGDGSSYDLNLDFIHKFSKPKEELTLNVNYSNGENNNIQTYRTNIYNINGNTVIVDPAIQLNTNSGENNNLNFQADYTVPVGNGKIEAGFRSQIKKSESNTLASNLNNATNIYDVNYALTNNFNNKDQVHAAYINFQNQVNNFGYQLGLRAEDATLNTMLGAFNNNGTQLFSPGKIAYTRLYPSVFLTQKFEKDAQAQLSYSRRVNRPRGWDTNPFLDVSDPLNFRQGNANLRPEDVHAFEFSLSKYYSIASLTGTAYFRQTNDVIQRIMSEPDLNGVTLTTPQNLTKSTSKGIELIGRLDVSKKWNFTANVNLYENKITGVPAFGIAENSGFSWNANLTNNFTLPYNITLQIKGDYRAAEVQAQGKRKAMYGFDGGAKYDFPDKKSSLSLNVRDIFATRKWSNTNYGRNSISTFERYMQGTMANLTFSYRFGKSMFDLKKKKNDQPEGRPDEENF